MGIRIGEVASINFVIDHIEGNRITKIVMTDSKAALQSGLTLKLINNPITLRSHIYHKWTSSPYLKERHKPHRLL